MKKVNFIDVSNERLQCFRKKYIYQNKWKVWAIKFIPIFLSFFIINNFFLFLAVAVLWWIISTMFFDHRDIQEFSPTIRVWFGVPGSGKTSVGAWLSRFSINSGYKVLSNVQIKGTYKLDENDLGNYDMSFNGDGCHVIYDEATINGMDNRGYRDFSKSNKPLYFSIHRHMNNRVDVFSQGYDIDKRIRDRTASNGLFYLKRIPLKGFVMYRKIKKVLFIKKEDKQMIDGFSFYGLPRICYTKSVWNSFDTLDMSLCPTAKKDWQEWKFDDED